MLHESNPRRRSSSLRLIALRLVLVFACVLSLTVPKAGLAASPAAMSGDGSHIPAASVQQSTGQPVGAPIPGEESPVAPNFPAPAEGFTPVPVLPIGKRLAARGVYVNLFNASEMSAVTAGGIDHGAFFVNWAVVGTDLDLRRIANIPGATIHVQADDIAGEGRSNQFNGSNYTAISIFSARDGLELRELTWDQHLFDDHVIVLAGRYNATGAGFDISEINCRFATFLCSTPRVFVTDASGPSFQTSSWVADVVVRPMRSFYGRLAIFEEEPWLRANNHGSWPGPDWGLNQSQGAFVPAEIGYKTSFADEPYPREFVLGETYDTMKYSDFYYNTRYQPLETERGRALTHSGRATVYLQAQQTVWRPTLAVARGLVLFADASFETAGTAAMRANYEWGFLDYGPFAGRPKDTIGLAFEVNLFEHRAIAEANAIALAHGIRTQLSNSETLMEANYGVHPAAGVALTPYLEYIWHPDQLALAVPRRGVDHAVQVGFTLRLDFDEILGLPILARLRD